MIPRVLNRHIYTTTHESGPNESADPIRLFALAAPRHSINWEQIPIDDAPQVVADHLRHSDAMIGSPWGAMENLRTGEITLTDVVA